MDQGIGISARLAIATRSVTLLMLAAVAGCGGDTRKDPADVKLTETGRLGSVVTSVGEAMQAGDNTRFESLFAEGAAPPVEQRSKYGPNMMFKLVGNPEISGDTATLTVSVVKVDEKTEEETVVGEAKWTAVRKGDDWWVLKTALVP